MGFFSRLGGRISSGIQTAGRLGKKVLGNVNRIGNTIAHHGEKILNVVDRIPIVGQVLSPVSGVVRSGIGLVRDVADVAGKGKELIEAGEKLLESGDVVGAGKLVKSKLEKGSDIRKGVDNIASATKSLRN